MAHLKRNIPRWLLAFIGSLLLFASLALICIRMTLFNQNFMIQQVRRTGYVETIRKDMTESIQDLGRGSNIPPEVLSDVVPKKVVSANVENYIRSIYQEVPFEIQGEAQLKKNILNNVQQYAQQKNIPIDETTQKNVTHLADSLEQYRLFWRGADVDRAADGDLFQRRDRSFRDRIGRVVQICDNVCDCV